MIINAVRGSQQPGGRPIEGKKVADGRNPCRDNHLYKTGRMKNAQRKETPGEKKKFANDSNSRKQDLDLHAGKKCQI